MTILDKLLLSLFFIFVYSACTSPKQSKTTSLVNYDSLRLVLEDMRDRDQNIRRILVDSIGVDSPNAGPYIKQMMDIDEENQQNIRLILEKYGWLEQSKIGPRAAEAFFFTVQHADLAMMEKYFPALQSLALKGEANPLHSAMMEDRLLMYQGKKQNYGTQAADFRADKQMAIWPIENPDSVNAIRQAIGFKQSVEAYAQEMEAMYDPQEKLPVKK